MSTADTIGQRVAERVDFDELRDTATEWLDTAGRQIVAGAVIGVQELLRGLIVIGGLLLRSTVRAVVAIGAVARSRIESPGAVERQAARVVLYGGAVLLLLQTVGVVEFTAAIPDILNWVQ